MCLSVALSSACGAPAEPLEEIEDETSVPYAGAVYVFTRQSMTWTQEAYVKASNPDPFDFFEGKPVPRVGAPPRASDHQR